MTKLFFATDIHGSDICWSKFLNAGKFYGADVLILGGDMTGKAVVPFIHRGGNNYRVTLLEQVLLGYAKLFQCLLELRERLHQHLRRLARELRGPTLQLGKPVQCGGDLKVQAIDGHKLLCGQSLYRTATPAAGQA